MPFQEPKDLRFFHRSDDVVDLVGTHPFKPVERHQPDSKARLVSEVEKSSKGDSELRAIGSAWSLSPVGVAPSIIDTLYLWRHLSPPYGATGALDASRLAPGASDVLGAFCSHHSATVGSRRFVHVEAGIKIGQLLEDLKSCGLALPTMGAGGGQSLAGALSTSTHGADFMVPPLVEWVRALHLVGPAGKDWWITPTESIFTGNEVLQLSGWRSSGEILANDDAFNAARVAVGRMGVIYSLILEVVEAYALLEITHQGVSFRGIFSDVVQPVQRISHQGQVFANGGVSHGQVFTNTGLDKNSWSAVREQLSKSGVANGQPYGIFDSPITDFNTGWLREEVIEPTVAAIIEAFRSKASATRAPYPQSYWDLSAIDPIALSLADEFYGGLMASEQQQLDLAALPMFGSGHLRSTFEGLGLTDFAVRQMGLQQLEAGLRGSAVKPLRHLNITVSLATPDVCWITRRWALPGMTSTANLGRKQLDEVEEALRQPIANPGADPQPVLTLVSNQIVDAIKREIQRRSTSLADIHLWPLHLAAPGVGSGVIRHLGVQTVLIPVVNFIGREVPRIVQAVTAANGTSGEALFLFLYRAATDSSVEDTLRSPIVSRVTEVIGNNAYVNPIRAGNSNDVLDTHSYQLDYTACGDSAEYFFDASEDGYLAFADAVIELSSMPSFAGPVVAQVARAIATPQSAERPIFGYMGIRFTPRSSALLAMQRYALTASVEVATARARTDSVYPLFWAAVHKAARTHGGIPHWGQQFNASAADVSAYYGEDLDRWRRVLAEVSVDDPTVFSTDFTREVGLEPSGPAGVLLDDALKAFLRGLEAASDV